MLIDTYELISYAFTGWTLTEIKSLSHRERNMWLNKAAARLTKGVIDVLTT